jgi:hypothetical protein
MSQKRAGLFEKRLFQKFLNYGGFYEEIFSGVRYWVSVGDR